MKQVTAYGLALVVRATNKSLGWASTGQNNTAILDIYWFSSGVFLFEIHLAQVLLSVNTANYVGWKEYGQIDDLPHASYKLIEQNIMHPEQNGVWDVTGCDMVGLFQTQQLVLRPPREQKSYS